KRDHRLVEDRVAGRSGRERGERSGFGDALFEHLAVLRLFVIHELPLVLRLIKLTFRGVDADVAEQGVETESAGFVRDDRDDPLADLLVAYELREEAREDHRRRGLA